MAPPTAHENTPSATPAGHDPLLIRINQVCSAIGDFIEYWGFKAIHGRVWALLAMRRQPLPQAEIARILGVSRPLISAAVAELMSYGLLKPTDSSRNAPYEAVMDVWPTISDVLRSREWMLLESARLALEAAMEEIQVARVNGREVPYDTERMRFLLTMTELGQAFLKTLIALRAPRSVDGLRAWATRAAALIQGFRKVW